MTPQWGFAGFILAAIATIIAFNSESIPAWLPGIITAVLLVSVTGIIASVVASVPVKDREGVEWQAMLQAAAVRAQYRLGQARLGHHIGVSRQTIASLEPGQFRPGLPLAFRLGRLFHVKVEDLFSPDTPRHGPGHR